MFLYINNDSFEFFAKNNCPAIYLHVKNYFINFANDN